MNNKQLTTEDYGKLLQSLHASDDSLLATKVRIQYFNSLIGDLRHFRDTLETALDADSMKAAKELMNVMIAEYGNMRNESEQAIEDYTESYTRNNGGGNMVLYVDIQQDLKPFTFCYDGESCLLYECGLPEYDWHATDDDFTTGLLTTLDADTMSITTYDADGCYIGQVYDMSPLSDYISNHELLSEIKDYMQAYDEEHRK